MQRIPHTNIKIYNNVCISIKFFEKILTVHNSFKISFIQITQVLDILFETSWKEIKVIGTHIPNKIMARTFYSNRGMEFWLLRNNDNPIIINLENYKYNRIIIGIKDRNE